MKAITLTQPWATLVALDAKRIETRSWSTKYRGPLAIHAAKGFPKEAQQLLLVEPFASALEKGGVGRKISDAWFVGQLPLGCMIATCELVNVVQFGCLSVWVDPTGKERILEKHPISGWVQVPPDGTDEYKFGDYTPGRYAWILSNIKPLPEPIPVRGSLGVWEWKES